MATTQVGQVVVEVTQSGRDSNAQIAQFVVEVTRQRIAVPPEDAYLATPMIG